LKWKTLFHNGPYIPERQMLDISVSVKGKKYQLTELAAEMAYAWAAKIKTDYVKDKTFQKNFWHDFKPQLPKELQSSKWPDDWDFEEAYNGIQKQREDKKNRSKEEKEREKLEKEARKEKYGYAYYDGKKVEIMNYVVEPPGLFMGRGKHPLRGRWKPRINYEDIILNLSEKAKIPPGKWKGVVHNHDAIWIAYWRDKLTNSYKYVLPSPKSYIRQQNDINKFEKAMKLIEKMPEMMDFIETGMKSSNSLIREIATVCSLIAHLGIRVGDEKDEDEAETYGATTLLRKHVEITRDYIFLSFLGKDSILYRNRIKLPKLTVRNLKELIKDKKPDEQVFQNTTSKEVNLFLSKVLPGATAKVFRTAIATAVMKNFLEQYKDKNISELEKIKIFKEANILVAQKLNHRKTPTESAKTSIKKKQLKIKELKHQLKDIQKEYNDEIAKLKQQIKNFKNKSRAHQRIERTKEKYEKKLSRFSDRIKKLELQAEIQKKSLDLNLGTSLSAYVNPRVTFGWAKEVELELNKIYTKSNIEKFKWAKE